MREPNGKDYLFKTHRAERRRDFRCASRRQYSFRPHLRAPVVSGLIYSILMFTYAVFFIKEKTSGIWIFVTVLSILWIALLSEAVRATFAYYDILKKKEIEKIIMEKRSERKPERRT
jgi:divalent metal cation (Fe/Co/Zn/Cd) transporter